MTTTLKQLPADPNAAVPKISPQEARALVGKENLLVVDARGSTEAQNTGKVAGAVHVPRGMIEFRADPESPYHDKSFNRDQTVLLYCGVRWTFRLAGKTLKDLDYKDVRNLGGFKDWAESGGAVEKI